MCEGLLVACSFLAIGLPIPGERSVGDRPGGNAHDASRLGSPLAAGRALEAQPKSGFRESILARRPTSDAERASKGLLEGLAVPRGTEKSPSQGD